MEKPSWIGRLMGRKPGEKQTPPSSPQTRRADLAETVSYEPTPHATAPGISIPVPAAISAATGDAEARVPDVWQVGEIILDLYEVKAIHEGGGMGLVYRVRHRGWGVDLAVKSPRSKYFQSEKHKENFVHEAETWVNLGLHPHIVSCYYVRNLGGIPHVFAEYMEGGSLKDWIADCRLYAGGQEQALERILDVAIQFAWGLQYAHEQGLIHQDVKPANVMMTPDGAVKVADFGLAQARNMAGEAQGQGQAGQSMVVHGMGLTFEYASPEQADGKPLTRKTDIWSWGVSVLEMFVGGVTWLSGGAAQEVLAMYQEMEEENPMLPVMPAEVRELLERCFQPRPEDRPATMLQVATDLQAIYDRLVERPYPRQAPKPAELLADSLNNQALSLYDLGKGEEAKKRWEQALAVDPHHLETTYNRGVLLWRRGELTDDTLVQQLESVLQTTQSQRWQVHSLQAQVHLERGEVDTARLLLEEALQLAPAETEIQTLLRKASSASMTASRCLRTFQEHAGRVFSVSLSADGRLALSGSEDRTLRLWEVSTGRCLRVFTGHTDMVYAVSLSADGRLALSGGRDRTLRLWEVSTGRCLQVFTGYKGKVTSVSLSADGRLAASASEDRTLRLWEVSTGRCLHAFWGQTWSVYAVSLAVDGRLALSGSSDGTLRLWEVGTGRCLRTFTGHTLEVNSVSLSVDGRLALSGGMDMDRTLRLWEVSTGDCLRVFEGHTNWIDSVSLSVDGRLALSGSKDGTLRLWDVSTGRCLRTFHGHVDSVTSVSLSVDGRLALSGGLDGTVRLWELPRRDFLCPLYPSRARSLAEMSHLEMQANTLLEQAEQAHKDARFTLALTLLQELRALPGWERALKSLQAWSRLASSCSRVGLRTSWHVNTFHGHTWGVNSVSLSVDGRLALSGSVDHTLRLWEISTGRCLRVFEGHTDGVNSASLSADGRLALSGSKDRTLRLWDVSTGRCLRVFEGHTDGVTSVSLSADGRVALSGCSRFMGSQGSRDHTLRLWEVSTGRCLRVFEGHTGGVTSVSLSADGHLALSSDHKNSTLQLWELGTGRCLRVFEGHTSRVDAVSFSADGHFALSGSRDMTMRLWELDTGRCLWVFEHTSYVDAVSFSADGRFALSGSLDQMMRLWELDTGRCLRVFEGHTSSVGAVSFSTDGRFALSGSGDKTLRLWELEWELEAHDPVDWNEGALPVLETFLTLHTPPIATLPSDRNPSEQEVQQFLTRCGTPTWSEQDFQELIRQLQYAGYGWLRPEGVRRKLEEKRKLLSSGHL